MKVSREQLLSYSIAESNFFPTRADRNAQYPEGPNGNIYIAVANDPNVDMTDKTSPLWQVEQWNGVNWTLVSIGSDFALIVTNQGLRAATIAQNGTYKVDITSVKVRSTSVPRGSDVINWENTDFVGQRGNPSAPSLIVLNSRNSKNTTFSLSHNFGYRINMANGGIQYSLFLDVDTQGWSEALDRPLSDYTIGAVGLYVADPDGGENDILFAVGNISTPISKYTTRPDRVGNSIKLYLNTTLTNLGYVSDVRVMPENVQGIPEVVSDKDLQSTWDAVSTPHNIVLVDNLYGTNMPALAVRTGDPVVDKNINWTYILPSDDSMKISDMSLVSSSLKDYMAVAWDPTANEGKGQYVPADGDIETLKTQGIKVGESIIYNGTVRNLNTPTQYNLNFSGGSYGLGYRIGDELVCKYTSKEGKETTFNITISNVNTAGEVLQYTMTPQAGVDVINTNDYVTADYKSPSSGPGQGIRFKIQSIDKATNAVTWDFPDSWLNKPLYVDTGANKGLLTTTETESFIGWCLGSNSIKLAMDLRNEASDSRYGTTRYATDTEVSNVSGNPDAKKVTTITPETLQQNYIQKTKVANNPGESLQNPVQVDSYIKFNQTVVGKGVTGITQDSQTVLNGNQVSFYGISYRALWADLAEYYRSDKIYPAGTLITIGDGHEEITLAKKECNGIVSSNPGYVLGEKESDYDLPIALVGKVPVRFASDCLPKFGNRIYLSKTQPGLASTIPNGKCLGKIIDKRSDLSNQVNVMCSVKISF